MTPEEQRGGETLDERLAREDPEGSAEDREPDAGQLVDEGPSDTEKEMIADREEGPEDVDEEDELLRALGSGADDEPPMEEAAVRVVQDEAPAGSDEPFDGYVQDEERG